MSDDEYDDDGGGYDDGFESTASYSPGLWDPTETGALVVAGRLLPAPGEALTFGAVKELVAKVEALGGSLTLVLPGDTSTTGPDDSEACSSELALGVIVAGAQANDGAPDRVDREKALRELASAAARDHAAIAAALPEPLREGYLAARDQLLVLPVGPLPYAYLVRGVAGTAGDEGKPGEYHRGTDMNQESHDEGVWGEIVASGEFTDVLPVSLDATQGEEGYWLIAGYD